MTKLKCTRCPNLSSACKQCKKILRKEQARESARKVADAIALLVDSIVAGAGDCSIRRDQLEQELKILMGTDSPTDNIRGKSGTVVFIDEIESSGDAKAAAIAQAVEIAHWIDIHQATAHPSRRFKMQPYQIELLAEMILRKQTQGDKS